MITPRRTRLVRVRDLHAFRAAIVSSAQSVPSDSLVIVPNAGAATQLAEVFRRADGEDPPDITTREGVYDRLHVRLSKPPRRLTSYERDVMAAAAAREASDEQRHLRPGLIAALLRFYDQLRRQRQQVARFEELLEDTLQKDAEFDRGTARMLEQTHFLAAAFRGYERRVAGSGGADEHSLRERLIAEQPAVPLRSAIVTVADWIADPDGLYVADFDLLAQISGLESIDFIATEGDLASGFHQRLHDWMPGLAEVDFAGPRTRRPVLAVPGSPPERLWFTARDRGEELVGVARRVAVDHEAVRQVAVVYKRPLPYLYLARDVFGSAGIGYQTSDALPLAAEPFSAALDLVFEFVSSSFTRDSTIALLRSPHFGFGNRPLSRRAVAALDRRLSDARYLGDYDRLLQLAEASSAPRDLEAVPALDAAITAARELVSLRTPAPASAQIATVLMFLDSHDADREPILRPARAARDRL